MKLAAVQKNRWRRKSKNLEKLRRGVDNVRAEKERVLQLQKLENYGGRIKGEDYGRAKETYRGRIGITVSRKERWVLVV